MRVYVAGRMSSVPDFNFPAFHAASRWLRDQGYEVVSPAEHDEQTYPDIAQWPGYATGDTSLCPKFDRNKTMGWDLHQVLDADGIVLLPGWEPSTGANQELYVARATGKQVLYLVDGLTGDGEHVWALEPESQVGSNGSDTLQVVAQEPESRVAIVAEQPAHAPGVVTVIDGQPSSLLAALTGCAHATLEGQQAVVLSNRDAELLAEVGLSIAGFDPLRMAGLVRETVAALSPAALAWVESFATEPLGLPSTSLAVRVEAISPGLVPIEVRLTKGLSALAAHLHSKDTTIIGLMGVAQAGKDTVAGILMRHANFQRIAFADALRDILYALNPDVSYDPYIDTVQNIVDEYGWEWAKANTEVRGLLQRLGTEAGRKVLGEHIWVDTAMRNVAPGGRYVFTDVRFPNEAKAIKAAGGRLARVVRHGYSPVNDHPSETALDDQRADVTIVNDGTIEDLIVPVRQLLDPAFQK